MVHLSFRSVIESSSAPFNKSLCTISSTSAIAAVGVYNRKGVLLCSPATMNNADEQKSSHEAEMTK